jgi:hypothetical protein
VLLLEAVQGMEPVPVFWTATVTAAGDEPTALKRWTAVGVTARVAVIVELTVRVTGI